jgi:hypothetical protein
MKTEQEFNILKAETKQQCEIFIKALEVLAFEQSKEPYQIQRLLMEIGTLIDSF